MQSIQNMQFLPTLLIVKSSKKLFQGNNIDTFRDRNNFFVTGGHLDHKE